MKKVYRELSLSPKSGIVVNVEEAAQFAAPFHYHDGYELVYIVNGAGKFYGGERILNFGEDELYIFGSGYPHLFVNDSDFVNSGEMGYSIIIQFSENYLRRNFALLPKFKAISKLMSIAQWGLKVNPDKKLRDCFLTIRKTRDLSTVIKLLQILNQLTKIAESKIEVISSNVLSKVSHVVDDERLTPVFKYILEHFKDRISNQVAADLACMNQSAFCRYFKRKTKKTFSQFVNDVRITHATSLLNQKHLTVSEICFQCGFHNRSYFNRQFKIIIGKSPTEYRENL